MNRPRLRIATFEVPVDADGGTVRAARYPAIDIGSGTVLVLLHGALADGEGLLPLRDALAAAGLPLTAVAIDFPGHGASRPVATHSLTQYAACAEAVVARAAAGRPLILIGESLGGIVGLRFARGLPADGVRAAILADPPVGPRAGPYVAAAYRHIVRLLGGLPPVAQDLAAGSFDFSPADGTPPKFDFWPEIEADAGFPVLALSGTLAGDPDRSLADAGLLPAIFGAAEAARAGAALGERFEWRPLVGLGHLVLRQAPAAAAAEIAAFLARRGLA